MVNGFRLQVVGNPNPELVQVFDRDHQLRSVREDGSRKLRCLLAEGQMSVLPYQLGTWRYQELVKVMLDHYIEAQEAVKELEAEVL